MTAPSQPTGPKIIVPEGMKPAYTNLARISHSPADIVIDFAHLLPIAAKSCQRHDMNCEIGWIYSL